MYSSTLFSVLFDDSLGVIKLLVVHWVTHRGMAVFDVQGLHKRLKRLQEHRSIANPTDLAVLRVSPQY